MVKPVVKTMVRQAVPRQPMEVHGGADMHLRPVEDLMLTQVDTPEGCCDPVGSPHWSRLLAGPVDPWGEEPRLEQGTRKARENAGPLLNKGEALVTQDVEKAEVLNTSFISVFTGNIGLQESQVPETRGKVWRNEDFPLVEEDQVSK
ncbi:hypothetical protein QYF61_002924 [Mycteria americana]|uniref:Uncharacterized protein n=1 Tax=Mycteria americana TaxID=33587 RepID=A0AAN7RT64_MYCAM|nr:hypothetical protein QYF61_002924 [Mycteria americana]